jgi:S-adenosylmethionine hydrolase
VSRTFHGRDVFAPAAGHLAAGAPLERLGPPVHDPVTIEIPGFTLDGGAVTGEVLGWDRFGNLVTSITAAGVEALGTGAVILEIDGRAVGGLVDRYEAAREGEPSGIIGSTGRLEVFVRQGSARSRLGAGRGATVRVRRCPG